MAAVLMFSRFAILISARDRDSVARPATCFWPSCVCPRWLAVVPERLAAPQDSGPLGGRGHDAGL